MTSRLQTLAWAALVSLLLVPASWAAPAPAPAGDEGELDLLGHTVDGFYLDFLPFGLVELPRIFVTRDADGGWGLDGYWSTASALRSGDYELVFDEPMVDDEMAAEDDRHGEGGHSEAVGTTDEHAPGGHGATPGHDDLEEIIHSHEHLYLPLASTEAGTRIVADLSITRHYVFGLLGALIVLAIFIPLANKYKRGVGRETAPQGIFQNMFETLVVFVRDEIARPNIGHKYHIFLPYLLTAFFFILVCNLIGLVPYGAAATANIAVTGILAACTLVIGHVRATGDYWKHIFWPPGVPVPIKFILIPVEFLGIFTKHIALAIRLFANMAAGTLVILALLGMIFTFNTLFGAVGGGVVAPFSVLLTLFISLVKLLVAFIQAYVFTMLSALFIGMAVEEHHHEDHVPAHGSTPAEDRQPHDMTPHLVATQSVEGGVARPATAAH